MYPKTTLSTLQHGYTPHIYIFDTIYPPTFFIITINTFLVYYIYIPRSILVYIIYSFYFYLHYIEENDYKIRPFFLNVSSYNGFYNRLYNYISININIVSYTPISAVYYYPDS